LGFEAFDTSAEDGTSKVSGTYFLFWLVVTYCAWTLFEIPHLAWGGELAHSSNDKTRLYSIRTMVAMLGGLLFFGIPYLPFFETREITPQTLQLTIITAAFLMLPLIYISIKYTPKPNAPVSSQIALQTESQIAPQTESQIERQTEPQTDNRKSTTELASTLKSMASNRHFVLFVTSFLFSGLGGGCSAAMAYIFIDSYLGLAEKYPMIGITVSLVAIPSIALWYKLCGIFGKKRCWLIGLFINIICFSGYSQLAPESSPFIPLLILTTIMAVTGPALSVAPLSLLSDIIDHGTLTSGKNQAGSYFSVFTFLAKTNVAIGTAAGLGIAGWYGFDASATVHSTESIFGLQLSVIYLPIALMVAATAVVFFIPMNEEKHRKIRQELDIREAELRKSLHRSQAVAHECSTGVESGITGAGTIKY
jgi:Na+/melibiose symporter-like transporter